MVLKFTRINERADDKRPETATIVSIRDAHPVNGVCYSVEFDSSPGFRNWVADPEEVRESEPDYTGTPTHLRIYRDSKAPVDDKEPWVLEGVDDFGNYTQLVWFFSTQAEAIGAVPRFIEYLRIEGYEFKPRKRGGFSIHQ